MLNIVLFGAPGAGKGTQAGRIIERYNLHHISTGEVIREEIRNGSQLGLQARGLIEQGHLAPDDLVVGLVADYLEKHNDREGNIFDGFPRTIVQAREFDRILDEHNIKVDVMLYLDVPDDVLVARLLARGKKSGRTDDKDFQIIQSRLSVYKTQTAIVADYYASQGKYVAVNGVGNIDEITARLFAEIEKLYDK